MTWELHTIRDTGIEGQVLDPRLSTPGAPHRLTRLDDFARSHGMPKLIDLETDTSGVRLVSMEYAAASSSDWVLILRGKMGRFGAAGTRQAALAPEGTPARVAWSNFFAALGENFWVDPHDLAGVSAPALRRRGPGEWNTVEHVLRGLLNGDSIIALDSTSHDMVATISSVLEIIPETFARSIVWSTLSTVIPRQLRPPRQLVTSRAHSNLIELPDAIVHAQGSLGDERTESCIEWLVEAAVQGEYPLSGQDLASPVEIIQYVENVRPLTVRDLERIAAQKDPLGIETEERICRAPRALAEFTAHRPADALALLTRATGVELTRSVYDVLWADVAPPPSRSVKAASQQSGRHVLFVALLPEIRDGSTRFASRFRAALSDRQRTDLARALGEWLPPSLRSDRRQNWATALGLNRDMSPEWFAFDPEHTARHVRAGELLAALQEIRVDDTGAVDRALQVFQLVTPDEVALVAHEIVARMTTATDRRTVFGLLVAADLDGQRRHRIQAEIRAHTADPWSPGWLMLEWEQYETRLNRQREEPMSKAHRSPPQGTSSRDDSHTYRVPAGAERLRAEYDQRLDTTENEVPASSPSRWRRWFGRTRVAVHYLLHALEITGLVYLFFRMQGA